MKEKQTVLVTGGAGYIGSHTCVALQEAGFRVVVADSLANSSAEALDRVARITGQAPVFYQVDLRDRAALTAIFAEQPVAAVIHFAGLKAVGESVAEPLRYYRHNLDATLTLLECMTAAGVKSLLFSSSATVYGDPASVPIREDFPLSVTNPYGRTKLMIEEILRDLHVADPAWNVALLRYFNPVGAHASGLIGEDPRGIPNNLAPYIAQVAAGMRPELLIFGDDYPTPDGTGVRDYLHVMDLAVGHVAALRHLAIRPGAGEGYAEVFVCNLGTGRGYSVRELAAAFARAAGREIPCRVVARRTGDVAACYADPSLARQTLGWQAERGLDEMAADAWRWQSRNPHGYEKRDQPANG